MKYLAIILFFSVSSFAQTMLDHIVTKFNCAEIVFKDVPDRFQERLHETLIYLKQKKVNDVWLTIARDCSELIPHAVKEGFIFHHAKEDKLVLTLWLPEGENYLPAYATRTVGVWVLVVDEDDRILVIKEKYDTEWGYKFPSGAVKMGEDIKDGATREVKEETGIDAEFINIIAFVERHNTRMDNISDVSFICVCKPLNN
jgi:Nudix hydrolase domain/NUDIX domain